jgi:hypothetical protein
MCIIMLSLSVKKGETWRKTYLLDPPSWASHRLGGEAFLPVDKSRIQLSKRNFIVLDDGQSKNNLLSISFSVSFLSFCQSDTGSLQICGSEISMLIDM